ncbi:MAG: phosphoenolpyruvate--protein phosphotransferase [Candidatus Desulfatibia sp.]|uniref:phosphoenolpyruvate--protein phosphotransferase n=1 Tax=Candidatus Desulfatibia sp. TaxID=3101189 RepID=UPI002F2E8774
MLNNNDTEMQIHGIAASPGICVGKAYLVGREGVDVVEKYSVKREKLKEEIKRFKDAVKKAKDELYRIIEQTPKDLSQHAHILETHMVLFKDKMLYGRTIETIENEQVNAEWALKTVASNVKAMFSDMTDSYLRARAADIIHVSDSIMRNLIGAETESIASIGKQVILVATDLSPAETSQIQLEKVMGFITDRGGKASHTAIIARSLEIPAVLGLENATRIIKNDDIIIVDGTSGVVIINPTGQALIQFEERQERYEEHKAVISRESHLPAVTLDGIHLQVMGNIELPEEVVAVMTYGGDGIGLYRTEFQYLSRSDFPSEDELFDKYKDVVDVITPRPVTIRTLDINGDKAASYASDSEAANPVLGLRGIRYCLQKPDVFKTQLRAILRASAFGHIRILLPMISCLEEILETKKILNEVADSLDNEGIDYDRNIEVGIMIEVPSAAILADIMAKNVDFFSIGTNDLIQFSLAVDRVNRQVAHLYQPLHPAVIRMVKHVADVARDSGINVFMCGEMASDPMNLPILLGLGLEKLSMNPQSIPMAKKTIRSLAINETRPFIAEVLKETTTKGVMNLVQNTYGSILSDKIFKEG